MDGQGRRHPERRRLRILVVDDSLTLRNRIAEVLSGDPELEVIGQAEDGVRAVELCCRLRPDVVTMDMMMPRMTGLAATEQIMGFCPTPVLIVSASFNRGEVFNTFDALRAGAVDVLEKPLGEEGFDVHWERKLRSTVKLVSRVAIISHLKGRLERVPTVEKPAPTARSRKTRILALGASTGGPPAVAELLRSLPPRGQLPIFLVIHIGEAFAAPLVEWMGTQTRLPVVTAVDGMPVPDRTVIVMPPPDRHVLIRGGRVRVTRDSERHSCRPSVDVLFESIAREFGSDSAAALLTGMGRDGALGMKAVRSAGGLTVAQDEGSSVVFGMPREAIRLGAACRVMALHEIQRWVCDEVTGRSTLGTGDCASP